MFLEIIKIISIFCQIGNKYIFGMLQNFKISLCVPWDEKGWKLLHEVIEDFYILSSRW